MLAGTQELKDIDAYIAGINAQRHAIKLPVPDWKRVDVVATTCLLGARFGAGGGAEASRAQLLSGLQKALGAGKGLTQAGQVVGEGNQPTPTQPGCVDAMTWTPAWGSIGLGDLGGCFSRALAVVGWRVVLPET